MSEGVFEPIVIDPPGFDIDGAWKECRDFVDECGGLQDEAGKPNWRAAFGADPGVCACPACHRYYWLWGRRHRCSKCGFEYPTDWWPMYSWGVAEATRQQRMAGRIVDERMKECFARMHRERIGHPYYRYGYEHPVDGNVFGEAMRIDWRSAISGENRDE